MSKNKKDNMTTDKTACLIGICAITLQKLHHLLDKCPYYMLLCCISFFRPEYHWPHCSVTLNAALNNSKAMSGTLLWLLHSVVLVRLYIITESQMDESESMKMFFYLHSSFFFLIFHFSPRLSYSEAPFSPILFILTLLYRHDNIL